MTVQLRPAHRDDVCDGWCGVHDCWRDADRIRAARLRFPWRSTCTTHVVPTEVVVDILRRHFSVTWARWEHGRTIR